MRIYLINAAWIGGGAETIAREAYVYFSQQGHECRFAYGRKTIPADVNSYRIGNVITPYLHAASARIFDNAGFSYFSKGATQRLVEDIKRFAPDVINLHNPLGYSMHMGVLFDFFRQSHVPVVWTLHDCWSITGHCITAICGHWQLGCGNCPQKKEYPSSYVCDNSKENLIRKEKCFNNISNMILVSPSKWLQTLVSKTRLNQYTIKVIPNGIDLDVFKPMKSALRAKYHLEQKHIVLFVASVWTNTKGADCAYRLSQLLDDKFALVMIGKNDDQELQKEKIIHIKRTFDRNELAQWYTVADVFVNPTLGDNFPTVNLEAMACGTPVVTFDTGGSGESVGDCGVVVPQGDIEGLKEAIVQCINAPISEEECVRRARSYDRNQRFGEYVSLFEECRNQRFI